MIAIIVNKTNGTNDSDVIFAAEKAGILGRPMTSEESDREMVAMFKKFGAAAIDTLTRIDADMLNI